MPPCRGNWPTKHTATRGIGGRAPRLRAKCWLQAAALDLAGCWDLRLPRAEVRRRCVVAVPSSFPYKSPCFSMVPMRGSAITRWLKRSVFLPACVGSADAASLTLAKNARASAENFILGCANSWGPTELQTVCSFRYLATGQVNSNQKFGSEILYPKWLAPGASSSLSRRRNTMTW
jgi:hypothetical protein